MQSFTFAPPTLAPRENQRNYVFVDEHNRHKRLKVMRACEGCRRRKIKCDAATTNSWPCAACIRLKLNCVPPTFSYDKDYNPGSQTFELEKPQEYQVPMNSQNDYPRQPVMSHMSQMPPPQLHTPVSPTYAEGIRMYQSAPYIEQHSQEPLQYPSMSQAPVVGQELNYTGPQLPQLYSPPPPAQSLGQAQSLGSPDSDGSWRNENVAVLSDALGELKIDHTAIPSYISNEKKTLAETPAQAEYEVQLPPSASLDPTVRIPPEMMPSEEQALQYFDYFFTNIHPYCPVINRASFNQQWQTARESISPLMLEAIFACASFMMEGPSEGNKWLALASKHEESFKDVPRLSTVQAMILLLKARESVPKRGYFWRSWMTVVNLVAMAKDLELNDHYEMHQMGRPCGSSFADCISKTRVWHTLFVLEIMIGGPQGRTDFGVNLDTVDFNIPRPIPGQDESEYRVSCQFTQYIRIVKNIQQTTTKHGKLRKKSNDWALNPEFVGHNADFPIWLRELPQDMQVAYPWDGSAPDIPSHFIANMHSYHYLAVIMHLRPQVHALGDSFDGIWKQHMVTCYNAAKNMCRLQEAVLKTYGLPGLLCMQRGISFTIYAVLTCTMLHLVAITCPDPELNHDAREFFVRHMRILETCVPSWPLPEMHQQVNTLRQAFSADVNKPFDLKPSFPFGSPQVLPNSPPLNNEGPYRPRLPSQHSPLEQSGQVHYYAHPISPPISASDRDHQADSPVAQSLVMMAAGQRAPQTAPAMQMQEQVPWNPNKIIDQWNIAFGTPPPSSSSHSSPPLRPPPSGNYEAKTPQESNASNYQLANVSPQSNVISSAQSQIPAAASYATPSNSYVTPTMWQEVVASSFGGGLKRGWDYGNASVDQPQMHKRVR
ncbi:hypothetical protein GQ43DRAFT_366107 [Delitschia confertaspora ATCC 74209]|uniref:Zn(2)-C6 fungal-type domain-containing protein n=1 Tax=Delitschia confertaspora ATCC 74209 TaxID=1513339 RepID=A0A9P4N1E8_9PLEO|nr:hypothetical protein GQ43DRAFT_366107 [Delitschia confertaspora ATCC 74209]